MNTPCDIFITAYLRPQYTLKTIEYLKERTKYPYRLWLIDQGETNLTAKNHVDNYIGLKNNIGIHGAWNIALALAESEYFITSDNDIYVPDLFVKHKANPDFPNLELDEPDWLMQMVKFMDERSDYGAISLHPHVMIGDASFAVDDPEDVIEVPHCGAVMRIMRTEAVRKVGGWEHKIDPKRNHEERWISGKLKEVGYKVGRTTRIRAYHPFGGEKGNWGYPEEITPEIQGHNPDLKEYIKQFDHPESYDEKTWLPK